jgi:capsular exopolysaccharide synthesis family protein
MPENAQLQQSLMTGQAGVISAPGYILEREPTPRTVPLTHYLWVLRRHLWKVVTFVATCIVATAIVSARIQPVYESTAIVDVDRQMPSEVVGANSDRTQAFNDADQFLATQVKMVQSDAVLRPVAEQYDLLDREGQLKGKDAGAKQRIMQAPVTLKRLQVTRQPNTYMLLISYRSTDPQLAADAASAIANSYLNHTYEIRIRSSSSLSSFMEKQIDELKAKMEKSSLALAQFEKDLDVINPEEKTNILSARLLQLNTEYTNAQADRVAKQATWNAMKEGSLEAVQISGQSQELARLGEKLNDARQQFATVKSTHGPSHPLYRKAASDVEELENQFEAARKNVADRIGVEYNEAGNREQMLKQAVAETKAQWDQINTRSFQYRQLKQEADADRNLYDELIKKIREADINSGFQNSNIRIADFARPASKPVFPNTRLNLALAFLFSTFLAIGAALLQDGLDTTLRDPKEISRFLGVEVIGVVPSDRNSAQLTRPTASAIQVLPTNGGGNGNRDAYSRSASGFHEAIRTLRNTILLSDFEGRLRSIMITSATPGEGKSTVASHLALSNADSGKKTLLVDGDLRRPSIHAMFRLNPKVGLFNVLMGEALWQEVVVPVEGRPNLHILPAGPGSHRAADLIGPRLPSLLGEFAKEYELVFLDSPPILGFAECLQMAFAADGVLVVGRAGETRRRAAAEEVSVLQRVRANIVGLVLNRATKNMTAESYPYYGYYGYNGYSRYASSYGPNTEKFNNG